MLSTTPSTELLTNSKTESNECGKFIAKFLTFFAGATLSQLILFNFTGSRLSLNGNDPTNPETLGFNSGIYKDSSAVYPGTGMYETIRVARISTRESAPGAYAATGIKELYDHQNAMYFKDHPNLKWVTTNADKFESVPGKIYFRERIGDEERVYVTRHNVSGYQQIGAYWVWDAFYFDGLTVKHTTGTFEVLACQ